MKFPTFYEIKRFTTVFKTGWYKSLTWARSIHSTTSHYISLRSTLMLPSHLYLGILVVSSLGHHDHQNPVYFSLLPSICHMPCPRHPPRFVLDTPHYATFIIILVFVVCFLLGNSPASEFYMLMFRNTLSVPSSQVGRYEEWLCLRMLGYSYGKRFSSKIAWATRKEGDRVGAGPSTETGCGG
jgi:hypothetical protein